MKYLVLLFALSPLCFAGNIRFSANGSLDCQGGPFFVLVPGPLYTISFSGDATFVFQDTWELTDGSVVVTNTLTGARVFSDTLQDSQASSYFGFDGQGYLVPSKTVRSGFWEFGVDPSGNGDASLSVNVPEPQSWEMVLFGFLALLIFQVSQLFGRPLPRG